MVKLYSNGCPKCKILERELVSKGIEFIFSINFQDLMEHGITSLPALYINDANPIMVYDEALKYVQSLGGTNGNN